MTQAVIFGLLGSSALVLGALVGGRFEIPKRVLAAMLAFASGALITALAFELFEDAHELRPPMLELIERLGSPARSGHRKALVLALARTSLLDDRPAWGTTTENAVRLRLEPLSDDESVDLARQASGRRIDDASHSIRFTPRKPSSTWSAINVAKVETLEQQGRMTDAGRAAFALRREDRTGIYAHEQGDIDFDDEGNLWLVTGDDTPATALGANNYTPFNDMKTNE